MRDERLDLAAVLDQPQLGVGIRAGVLQIDAVMHRDCVVVLAVDEQEPALRMRAHHIGRHRRADIECVRDPRREHETRGEERRQTGVVGTDLVDDDRRGGIRSVHDHRADRGIPLPTVMSTLPPLSIRRSSPRGCPAGRSSAPRGRWPPRISLGSYLAETPAQAFAAAMAAYLKEQDRPPIGDEEARDPSRIERTVDAVLVLAIDHDDRLRRRGNPRRREPPPLSR
jgi:hypothetical protein